MNSVEIKKMIDELQAEYDAKAKAEVLDVEGTDFSKHDALWRAFWDNYGLRTVRRIDELKDDLRRELNREIQVGDGATYCLWSDRYACTVVARTAKTLTLRRDKAKLKDSWKPEFVVGGFSAHCTNNEEQEWEYEPDPDGELFKAHWSEKRGGWQSGSDGSCIVIRGRHEYYDYNF